MFHARTLDSLCTIAQAVDLLLLFFSEVGYSCQGPAFRPRPQCLPFPGDSQMKYLLIEHSSNYMLKCGLVPDILRLCYPPVLSEDLLCDVYAMFLQESAHESV